MGDLRIIKNNVLRKLFTKRPNFRDIRPINFNKAKSCIPTGLKECICKWCNENSVNKNFFSEWTSNITTKLDDRRNVLNDNLRQYKNPDTLSFAIVTTALDQLHKYFVVVLIDKAVNNVALICKRFYASATTKELGLGNSYKTSNYKKMNDLSNNLIVN